MDRARALLQRHVIGKDAEDFAIEKRVLESRAFESSSRETREDFCLFQPRILTSRFRQSISNDVDFAALRVFQRDVFVIRMEGYGHRRRERPRRSRPDDGVYSLVNKGGI